MMRIPLVTFAMLGFVAVVAVQRLAFGGPTAPSGARPCESLGTGETGLKYGHRLFVERDDPDALTVRVRMTLLGGAPTARFRPLFFVGPRQVLVDAAPIDVACGQAAEREYAVTNPGPGNLTVVYDALPDVPQGVSSLSGDAPWVPSDLTLDHDTVVRAPSPPEFTPGVEPRPAAVVGAGHVYLQDAGRARTLLKTAPGAGRVRFGVLFAGASGPGRPFVITCLNGGRQMPAFGAERAVTVTLREGQEVRVPAEVEVRPGWQRVRCLALADVFAASEQDVDGRPNDIRSLYVFVPDDTRDGPP